MEWLVEGPRGRRLLWELLASAADRRLASPPDAVVLRDAVPHGLPTWTEHDLLRACADSVTWARYWEGPDETDVALEHLAELLTPVADSLQPPGWWEGPLDLGEQVLVVWEGATPTLVGSAIKLTAWYDDTLADERRAATERPADLSAAWSGRWWSTPAMSGLPATSRPVAGLNLIEDVLGWTSALLVPVAAVRPVRMFEVDAPGDWVRLVTSYPLELTASRRHDWWRATGATGRLFVPDFLAMADEWDGVHVSTRGYLTTATRTLSVPGGCTVMAGWNPDQTWWLTDCLRQAGPGVSRPRPEWGGVG